ncbi:hypothetical protein ACFYYR_31150 [Streptomyces sp. NPDC001922]|uniref:hypothetical protein n=1 Tax=Streptomyces sp. NPDC001922 TaxID=3364624 RepID=UPI0036BE9580
MTGRLRLTTAAVLCTALATGCGGATGGQDDAERAGTSSRSTPSATAPAPSASELDRLTQLVDRAESAAKAAESDTENDK